jgi:hypothetical protein
MIQRCAWLIRDIRAKSWPIEDSAGTSVPRSRLHRRVATTLAKVTQRYRDRGNEVAVDNARMAKIFMRHVGSI